MERIESDVRRELGRFGPAGGMADLVSAWPAAVGEAIAANAWPARFARDGTLHVNTTSAAWAFELGHLEAQLTARLREALGEETPPRLRFAVGRVPEASPAPAEAPEKDRIEPSDEHREAAARLAAGIEDEELRAAVARAAAESLARAPYGRSLW